MQSMYKYVEYVLVYRVCACMVRMRLYAEYVLLSMIQYAEYVPVF